MLTYHLIQPQKIVKVKLLYCRASNSCHCSTLYRLYSECHQLLYQIKSNQILFRNNKITFYISKQKEKYCYMVVTWHILFHLPVTPKHKLRNNIYIYIYIYIYTHVYTYPHTHLHDNGLGEFKKCVKMCENPNRVSF